MTIADRLIELDMKLPEPMQTAGLPFSLVRRHGNHLFVSGHVPLDADGSIAKPLGKVGAELTPEQGYEAARKVGLGMLASVQQAIGPLDKVERWLKLFGMVNVAPGFNALPGVINGCSDVLIEVFGAVIGGHARSAVGMAELPFGVPVEIEAELIIKS